MDAALSNLPCLLKPSAASAHSSALSLLSSLIHGLSSVDHCGATTPRIRSNDGLSSIHSTTLDSKEPECMPNVGKDWINFCALKSGRYFCAIKIGSNFCYTNWVNFCGGHEN